MSGLTKLKLEDTDASVQNLLRPTVERLGYFGELFQYTAHAPAVLEGFMKYSGALRTALPPNLNELIALTVCTQMQFPYERVQHERLSQTLGLDRAWIAELVGRGQGARLSDQERLVRGISLLVIEGRHAEARKKLGELAAEAGNPLAMSVLFQITRFMAVCAMGGVLAVSLPVPSIFEGDPMP
jgi:alkylhydroperoxidase family enzyme